MPTISTDFPDLRPGEHIKKVLPKGLSVKKAAELIGVGRPALSNLLNGKAALTPEMAMRIEKAFGTSAQELLALQTAYDELHHREQAKEIAVRTYIQAFLTITARNISAWSEQIGARAELPVLLRRLINSTGDSLAQVDFPAFDNSQRPGWDGYVSTDSTTPWIPRGKSGWEFGCDRNAAQKAEHDYASRTGSVVPEERKTITFVFVTLRNWPGKEEWAKAKRNTGAWKDVRAYDASDLEQWLEQSVATQAWLADKLGNGADGIATLDDCWKEWAEAAEPPLSKLLFRTAVETAKDKFQTWLTQPPRSPFVVTADSEIEGLAFIACALESLGKSPGEFYDRALVFKTLEALKRTTTAAPDFVAIVSSREIERASAGLHKTHHLLIIRRRNDISGEPNVTLDLVDELTYRAALTAMGLPDEDYQRYARETGNSPAILRRRLSPVPAIREPAWSTDKTLARKLIPLNFAGVWSSDTPADQEIMRLLASTDYTDIELAVTELQTAPDAPV
jgi:addiction module HigA family antidote